MKVSFVIPCYRSEKTLEAVVNEITDTMVELDEYDYEIILVNDCSPDNTFDVIRTLCAKDKRIVGISHAKNFGQHAALMAGFSFVTGDVVVCLDDDGQTPANEVNKLLDKIKEGYDVVYAEYEHKQHSGFRNWGSHVNKLMTEVMLNKPKELYVSSYFAARRFVVDEMLNYKGAYPYVIGLVLRTTRRICNVSVNHRERMEGNSGYTIKKLLALWMNGFTSFSILPLRIASYGGSFIAFIGFIYAIYVVLAKLLHPVRILGWSSIISVLLMLGGLILLTLGLIGEYIGRIYISINNSPQYVIKEIINNREEEGYK